MLLLAPIAEHHLADVQVYASNPSIGAMSTVPTPYPTDGAIRWYGHVLELVTMGRAMVYAITEDRSFRGVISINDINRDAGRAHVDYWVAAPYQGKGIASSAVAQVMDCVRSELKLSALLSSCLSANVASARVLERNGFTECGRSTISEGKFEGQELRRFFCRLVVSAPRSKA